MHKSAYTTQNIYITVRRDCEGRQTSMPVNQNQSSGGVSQQQQPFN